MKEIEYDVSEENLEFFGLKEQKDSPGVVTAQKVRDNCVNMLDQTLEIDTSRSKDPDTIYENTKNAAANLIIAQLLTRDRVLEKGGILHNHMDKLTMEPDKQDVGMMQSIDSVSVKIDKYRDYLLKDDSFQSTLKDEIKHKLYSEGVNIQKGKDFDPSLDMTTYKPKKGSDFVTAYKKEKKASLKHTTEAYYYKSAIDKTHADKEIEVDAEDIGNLKNLYEDMKAYNHGRERRGVNQEMMKALDNVIQKYDHGNLTLGDMQELAHRASRYYNNRKGTLFGPQTGEGKNRLGASEKIFKTAYSIANDREAQFQREDEKAAERQAVQKKIAEQREAIQNAENAKNKAKEDMEKRNEKFLSDIKNYGKDKKKTGEKDPEIQDFIKLGITKKSTPINAATHATMAASLYVLNYTNLHGIPKEKDGMQVDLKNLVGQISKNPEFRKQIGIKDGFIDREQGVNAVTEMKDGELTMRKHLAGKIPALKEVPEEKKFVNSLKPARSMK